MEGSKIVPEVGPPDMLKGLANRVGSGKSVMTSQKKIGRKTIDVDTFFYDLDAKYRRAALGEPGDPKAQVPKLLAKLRDKKLDLVSEAVEEIKRAFPVDYEKEKHALNLKNPEFIALLFEAATQIDDQNRATDRAIIAAFEKAGLNISSPMDWRLLMEMFCWAHFGEKGKAGAPIGWTNEQYRNLLRDVHEMKIRGSRTDAEALRQIKATKGKKYNNVSPVRLKKALAEARNPTFNTALSKPVYEALMAEPEPSLKPSDVPLAKLDAKSLLQRIADRRAAEAKRPREEDAKLKRIARQIADRIGAGEAV